MGPGCGHCVLSTTAPWLCGRGGERDVMGERPCLKGTAGPTQRSYGTRAQSITKE